MDKIMCYAGYIEASEMLRLFCSFVEPTNEKISDNVFLLFKIERKEDMNEIEKILIDAAKTIEQDIVLTTNMLVKNTDEPLQLKCHMIQDPVQGIVWKIHIEQENSKIFFVKMLFDRDIQSLENITLAEIFSLIKESNKK